jgi:cell division protein FtsL
MRRGVAIGDQRLHVPKTIDNSQIVREVDPRSSRDLWLLLLLVATLAGGMVFYAWPHFELRQTALAKQRMERTKERLLEQNRKLRLEKATLESLRRIESIAVRQLGLRAPRPEQLVVVEKPREVPEGALLASSEASETVERQ